MLHPQQEKFIIYAVQVLKLPALTNITDLKHTRLCNSLPSEGLLQQLRRLEHFFHRESPCPPVNTHCPLALGVYKNLNRVKRVCVHGRKRNARVVRANRNQAEVKRPTELANLLKLRTARERFILGAVVVHARGQMRDGAVACISAEPNGFFARADGP